MSNRESRKARRARTPRFEPFRVPASDRMQKVVNDVLIQSGNAETHLRLRKRKRRAADARVHARRVSALITEATYRHLEGRDGVAVPRDRTALSRDSGTRYRSDVMGPTLPEVIDLLSRPELKFLEQVKGHRSPFGPGEMTIIRPGARLLTRIRDHGITLHDATIEGQEIVVLKDVKPARGVAAYCDYADTEHTERLRAEVCRINAYLRAADIEYVQDLSTAGFVVDDHNRYMRRVFTRSSFESGGRLFGGFWQPIGKEARLSNTLINGESVVSLDFKGMGVMLAYHAVRATPPDADVYPTRFTSGPPDDPRPVTLKRKTVKGLMSACLFATKPFQRWPRDLAGASDGVSVGEAVRALADTHPAIAPLFFTGVGHALQFVESEILMDTMARLIAEDVVALPVHDCIVVAESAATLAYEVMADVFKFHTNLPARISIERASDE
jgi:hypothetical protein